MPQVFFAAGLLAAMWLVEKLPRGFEAFEPARISLNYGFLLLEAYVLGGIFSRIKLPRISGYIVAGIATAMLAVATATNSFGEGVVLGLVLGVGIATVLAFVTAVFDPMKVSKMVWFGVTAGYHALGLLVASVIVSVWN